jgi:hypothetical protein
MHLSGFQILKNQMGINTRPSPFFSLPLTNLSFSRIFPSVFIYLATMAPKGEKVSRK